jgi:hypothetical protein
MNFYFDFLPFFLNPNSTFIYIFIYVCVTQSRNLNNLGIFSTNFIIIVNKYFMRPKKYKYLESARRDLQNDDIYQMSRFAKFFRI